MSGYNRADDTSRKRGFWPMVLVLLAVLYFVNGEVFTAAAVVAAIVFGLWYFAVRSRR